MARRREKPSNTEVQESPTTPTLTQERGIMALTPEQIQALLGKTRSKGQYVEYINEFVNSGEGGVCANDQWVAIRDKKATTIKQGFENAKQNKEAVEGAENVKVISNEDKVFLINLAAANLATDADAA